MGSHVHEWAIHLPMRLRNLSPDWAPDVYFSPRETERQSPRL